MILDGKKVLITGGTGSLGKSILDRAEKENWGCQFTVISRDENKQSILKVKHPQVRFILGDVRDRDWLRIIMRDQDVVIHAAAYKQVVSAQNNVGETLKSNILGSFNVAQAAIESNVGQVIGISTDKSCSPVNLYGSSKNTMEHVFVNANSWGDTVFTLTRYGNVIGSRGSVIPYFLEQKQQGGPLTVTDKRMRRFFITLDEAVSLILRACDVDKGIIVVPKAGMKSVWRIAELIASGECEVIETEIRAGEKLDEAMINASEAIHTSDDEKFYYIHPPTQQPINVFPYGFEYTTATCPEIPDSAILQMIEEWKNAHG